MCDTMRADSCGGKCEDFSCAYNQNGICTDKAEEPHSWCHGVRDMWKPLETKGEYKETGVPYNSLEELAALSGGKIYPGHPDQVCRNFNGKPQVYTTYGWINLDEFRERALFNLVLTG